MIGLPQFLQSSLDLRVFKDYICHKYCISFLNYFMRLLLTLLIAFFLTAVPADAQRKNGAIVTEITDCGSPSPSATGRLHAYIYFQSFDKDHNCYNMLVVITADHPNFGEVVIAQGSTCIPAVVRTTMPPDLTADLKAVLNDCSYVKINTAVVSELKKP